MLQVPLWGVIGRATGSDMVTRSVVHQRGSATTQPWMVQLALPDARGCACTVAIHFRGLRRDVGLRPELRHPASRAASRPSKVPAAIFVPPSAGEGATR